MMLVGEKAPPRRVRRLLERGSFLTRKDYQRHRVVRSNLFITSTVYPLPVVHPSRAIH
jgi:hypothetical protein